MTLMSDAFIAYFKNTLAAGEHLTEERVASFVQTVHRSSLDNPLYFTHVIENSYPALISDLMRISDRFVFRTKQERPKEEVPIQMI